MDAKERRSAILQLLRNRTAPVTGAELAARMGVSRQVIVQDIALLRTGGLRFIITTNRNQYTMFSQFELLGVDITVADVVVVKIGYLEPDLYDTQKGWLMALTPGGVDQDLIRLGHHKIERPMFPFDPDMTEPDLCAQVVVP